MIEVLNIPIVQGGGPFQENILLENEEYIFAIHFNQRSPAWYLTIEKNGEIIVRESKIIAGYNLLDSAISAEKLPGSLYLYDVDLQTSLGNDPGINDLGDRIILVYEEKTE